MKKKMMSLALAVVMCLSLCVPAFAAENVNPYYETFEYVDSLGDTYTFIFTRDSKSTVAIVNDENGNLVAKSEQANGFNYIENTIPAVAYSRNISSARYVTETININDLIAPMPSDITLDESSINAFLAASGDSIPGSSTYKSNGTYNTDYTYQGNILKGEAFYRRTGGYTEYNRVSYVFTRNMTITAIFIVLGGMYSWLKLTAIKEIAAGVGIGITGAAITMDWNYYGKMRAYDFQYKCNMVHNGSTIKMSEITRKLEYLISGDSVLGTTNYKFDDFSYDTPTQGVYMQCSEAVGYAAKAFSVKYITESDPTLSLPVSGPVY